MSLINSLSSPVVRGEVDLFKVPPTDTTVESTFFAEFKPVVNIQDSDAKIEFRISGNSNQYLDLNDSFLYLTVKIVDKDGNNLSSAPVGTANNFLHSLFSQVDLYINNQLISTTNNCYAYKAYIESILSYGSDYMNSQAPCALFFKETNKKSLDDSNTGFKKRKEYIKDSKQVELIGKLKIDLCSQNRYILNDTNVCISLTKNSDTFSLFYLPAASADPKDQNPKVKFMDASFFVRKHVLYPSIAISHQKLLENGMSAHYPVTLTDVKQYTIPSGNQSFIEENVFLGRVPSRIAIGLVSNAAFNGDYRLDPYYFDHFSLNYLSVTVNNMPIPIRGLNVDFSKGQYLLPYYLLHTSLGMTCENQGLIFDRDEYVNGNVLFVYDLNDISSSDSTLVLENSGSVRIELKFLKPVGEAITCILYSESQAMINIDKYRQANVS